MSPASMDKCPNCDAPLPAGSKEGTKCPYCSVELTFRPPAAQAWPTAPAARPKPAADPAQSRRLLTIIIVAVVAPVVLSLVIGILTSVLGAGVCAAGMVGAGAAAQMVENSPPPTFGRGASTPTSWDGSSPLLCSGNQHLVFNGVTSTVAGTAVTATSNCHLTLINCVISAQVGVNVSGNAAVEIRGGAVTGSTAAMVVSGNAHVQYQGTQFIGPINRSGNADLSEL